MIKLSDTQAARDLQALVSPPISEADKVACLMREIKMRKQVYPHWVARGKMTQRAADREVAVMEAILADYRELADQKLREQPDLFATPKDGETR